MKKQKQQHSQQKFFDNFQENLIPAQENIFFGDRPMHEDRRPVIFNPEPRDQQVQQPPPWSRRHAVYYGEKDVYGINVALFSIFESQVILVNIDNLSKIV